MPKLPDNVPAWHGTDVSLDAPALKFVYIHIVVFAAQLAA